MTRSQPACQDIQELLLAASEDWILPRETGARIFSDLKKKQLTPPGRLHSDHSIDLGWKN